jgi:hypothetical protein
MKGELINQAIELACASLNWRACELISVRLVDRRQETRLRFNAPTEVEACALAAVVRRPGGRTHALEIEALFWISDGEWEIWDVQEDGGERRD